MSDELLATVREIKDLLRLIAEPQLAQRDERQRTTLKSIVGRSAVKARAVFLLDGSKSQAELTAAAKMDRSDISKLIKALRKADLLKADEMPALSIEIPPNFFELEER